MSLKNSKTNVKLYGQKKRNTQTIIRHGQKQRRKFKDKREAMWAKNEENTKTNIRHGKNKDKNSKTNVKPYGQKKTKIHNIT